jgi:hypothetical protein
LREGGSRHPRERGNVELGDHHAIHGFSPTDGQRRALHAPVSAGEQETRMASTPNDPKDSPRADETSSNDVKPVPDQDGPHDVPDTEVIEQTLPSGSPKKGDTSWHGDTQLPR